MFNIFKKKYALEDLFVCWVTTGSGEKVDEFVIADRKSIRGMHYKSEPIMTIDGRSYRSSNDGDGLRYIVSIKPLAYFMTEDYLRFWHDSDKDKLAVLELQAKVNNITITPSTPSRLDKYDLEERIKLRK